MPLEENPTYTLVYIVEEFIYLGTQANSQDDIAQEIQGRIVSAYRCFCGQLKLLKSGVVYQVTKMLLYKTF